MKFSLEELEEMAAFESQWDGKLGGAETRAHREMLSFAAARIMQAGASADDVVGYLRELIAQFWTDPAPRGSS